MKLLRWTDSNKARIWWKTRYSDPLPAWLVITSLPASILVGLIGSSVFGWPNILSNIAASLTLIGPGLFITNAIVRNAREVRLASEIAPVMKLIATELYQIVTTMLQIALEINLPIENVPTGLTKYGEHPNLNRLAFDIEYLRDALRAAPDTVKIPDEFDVSRAKYLFPPIPLVTSMAAFMHRNTPMADFYLAAEMTKARYDSFPIPLVHRGGVEGATAGLIHTTMGVDSLYVELRTHDLSGTWGDAPPKQLMISASSLSGLVDWMATASSSLLRTLARGLPLPLAETQRVRT